MEHSVLFMEHSVLFMEHSVLFMEHSVLFMKYMNLLKLLQLEGQLRTILTDNIQTEVPKICKAQRFNSRGEQALDTSLRTSQI